MTPEVFAHLPRLQAAIVPTQPLKLRLPTIRLEATKVQSDERGGNRSESGHYGHGRSPEVDAASSVR